MQTVYPLADNTGLALTTAHFYTPSGRLIQRDYSQHIVLQLLLPPRRSGTKNPLDVKMTDSGRTVYGGGGITPDEKFAAPKLNKFQIELLRKFAFFNFTRNYFGKHDIEAAQGLGAGQDRDERIPRIPAEGQRAQFTEAECAENHDWIKRAAARARCTSPPSAWRKRASWASRPIRSCERQSSRCRRPRRCRRTRRR